jgi:hypothetical protein
MFEGALNIDTVENDTLDRRLLACYHKVQESKYLMKQAVTALGETRL